jgi:beta-1,4-galactosyltransferase 1
MKKLALIIPYRNREEHLKTFLNQIHTAINQNQKLFSYSEAIQAQVFVIEQADNQLFNRGKLLNVGFQLVHDQVDYVCFHDVDMIPIKADYSYVTRPTHLAANVSQFQNWKGKGLAYKNYFGGVVLFNNQDFININGYSNGYWGYGAEDDDIVLRIYRHGLTWVRRNGQFESLSHPSTSGSADHKKNLDRLIRLAKGEEKDESGLSDLSFIIQSTQSFPSFTLYSVKI